MQVPRELREPLGKREVLRSLKTKSSVEARRTVHAERARIEAEFTECRRRLAADRARTHPEPAASITLSEAEVWALAVKWFVNAEREAQGVVLDAEALQDRLEGQDHVENPELASPYVESEVTKLLTSEGINTGGPTPLPTQTLQTENGGMFESVMLKREDGTVQPNWRGMGQTAPQPPWLIRLHRAVHQASVEHERRLLNRHVAGLGLGLDPQFAQLTAGSPAPFVQSVAPLTFTQLVDRFIADRTRARPLAPKSAAKQVAQFDLFKRIVGGKTPVSGIDRERARSIQDALVRLPANATKKFPTKSVRQLLDMPPDPKHPPMAALTINTYLTSFAALMRYAEREGLIAKSPAEGLRVADGVANKDRRKPISIGDLRAIFAAPLFKGMAASGEHIRPGRAMVPLVALFTGMRLNEICQLTEDDLAVQDGSNVIHIRPDAEGTKRVKTAAGERFIPIHSELVRLGFLRHVTAIRLRNGKTARLFPDLTRSAATGYYSDNYSKWFAIFLTKVGASPSATFHGLRHNFRDAMREAALSPEIVRALGGWSTGKTEDNYGNGFKASTLATSIEKIAYHGLDLSSMWVENV